MNAQRKVWLVLLAALLVAVTIACSCGDLSSLTGGGGEAIPGLAGRWEDPETLTVHTIEWQSGRYVVVSCIDEDGSAFSITEQNWDGSKLTWTYYVSSSDVSVGFETTSLNGDSLNTNWWNSVGRSGTEILGRVR